MHILILTLTFVFAVHAAETPISGWKVSPITPLPTAAFEDSSLKTAELLNYVRLDWQSSQLETSQWVNQQESELNFRTEAPRAYGVAATYLTADRFAKAKLVATGTRPFAVFSSGKELGRAASADSGQYEVTSEITLDRSRMQIVIVTASQASDSGAWHVSAAVKTDSASLAKVQSGTALPFRPAHFERESDLEDFGGLALSPDGKYLAFQRSIRVGDDNKKVSWYEIWDVELSKPYHVFGRKDGMSKLKFSHDGKSLYYLSQQEEGAEVWRMNIGSRTSERLLASVKGLESFQVSPDGKQVVYALSKEKPENKSSYELFREIEDRLPTFNNRRELYLSDLTTGVSRRLTMTGDFEVEKWSLSPGGKQLVLLRSFPMSVRPYSKQEFWTLDLGSGESKHVFTHNNVRLPQNICWIDDSRIAYSAGAHDASPDDTTFHNSAQLVAYTLNLRTGEHFNLTGKQEFSLLDEGSDPKIFYNPKDRYLYFHVARGGHVQFAKCSLDGKSIGFRPFKSRYDFTDTPTFAANGTRIAYAASGFDSPKAIAVLDVAANRESILFDPNAKIAADWELGTMEEANFVSRLGIQIDGWLNKPADFTPDKSWPLIVYFYAGVTPRDVRFSYTYQFWLANGYVVYVLNSVGAFGRGQEFADYHANDWGTEATQDVIEGTQKLLAAHPYLDATRMGCYGGSYGGFIVLDLLTKTSMFKTAVDMYGISNITNYFGGGTWGYWYGEIAAPGSFPWSHREIFVEKSPIYNADKIKTPLLILHGGADNNVPWIESDQMFVSLKLLGQEVVYARFKDETHNINTKYSNLVEHRQMMLEWFDRYLKDQPEAWESRMNSYPK